MWLVLGLMAPALGLGEWVRPEAVEHVQVVELGIHAGPEGHGSFAKHSPDVPLCSEFEDSKDSSEDELRERTSVAPLWLAPSLDLDFTASVRGLRFAESHDFGPGCHHRGAFHNRGPPVA